MNSTIQFMLKMQDFMSAPLARVGANSNATFSRMAERLQNANTHNRVLSLSYDELQNKIRAVERVITHSTIPSQITQARRELASLQRMSANHSGNTGGNGGSASSTGVGAIAGGTIIGNIATAGIAMIGTGIGKMIQSSMDKETAIGGLSTYLGKQGASEAYGNIEKDAEATPFDTKSLMVVNQALISTGVNAKTARTDSMNLANAIVAVGGSNDTLTRMAANMQQIKNNGKANAMDVRQFAMAGINIYGLLAKSTGKTIEQVREMDVTYEQLSETFSMARAKGGLYHNALETAQSSLQGKWSNLQEQLTNNLAKIGTAFSPLIAYVMDLGTSFLEAGNYIITFANWLNSGSTSANVFIVSLGLIGGGFIAYQAIMGGVAIATGVVTAAQWLLNIAMTANPIGLVVVAIGALIAGFAVAYNRFSGFRSLVDGVWGSLKQVGSNIIEMFSKIPDMVIQAFTQIPEAIKTIFMGVGDLFNAIFGDGKLSDVPGILKNIGGGILKANPVTGLVTNVIGEATKGVGDAFTKASEESMLNSKKTKIKGKDESVLGTTTDMIASNQTSGKSAGESVSGAGPKTVNIHVGKFFDNLQFTTLNTGETANEIEKIVMECFARVVYNGAKMV